jgi:hypothetical protein
MSKTCVLDSFACVLKLSTTELQTEVGHKGLNGYHTQELIQVCLGVYNRPVTELQRMPVSQDPLTHEVTKVFSDEVSEALFISWLQCSEGVLLGRIPLSNLYHAVAWVAGVVYDTACGRFYDLLVNHKISEINFIPHTLLRIENE